MFSPLRSLILIALPVISALTGSRPRAQTPGSLDLSFGVNGQTLFTSPATVQAVTTQSDNKSVVVGYDTVSSVSTWVVTRFNSDGTLDTSFGNAGRATPATGFAYDVAIDGSGNILVTGSTAHGTHSDFAVARLTSSGALDPTFGGTGLVVTHMSTNSKDGSASKALALQSDGKIVTAGLAFARNSQVYGLARYLTSGALDTSFGSGGIVRDDAVTLDGGVWARALTIQPDGKIVTGRSGTLSGWTVARYLTSGAIDSSYGTNGKATPSFPGLTSVRLAEVAAQPDNKIVAAGRCNTGVNSFDMIVTRHNLNGSLDASFGSGGIALTSIPVEDQGNGMALQADGKILVTGTCIPAGSPVQMLVFRFLGNGTADPGFGFNGLSALAGFGTGGAGRTIAIDGLGRIVGVSYSQTGIARWIGD